MGGVKYNCLNSTFKIDIKKGLDSEDADRRDSMTPQIFSSFCRADEKLYKKPIFSLPNGKTQKGVISKHNQAHAKFYLTFFKYEYISVRIQKKRKRCASDFCGGSTDLELQIIDMDPKVSKLCF